MKPFIEFQESYHNNKFCISVIRVRCDREELLAGLPFVGTKEEVLKLITESEYFNMGNVYFVVRDVDYFDHEINQIMLQEYGQLPECDQWSAENIVDDLPF